MGAAIMAETEQAEALGGPLFVRNIRQTFDLSEQGIPVKGTYRPMIPSQLIEELGEERIGYLEEIAKRAADPDDDSVQVTQEDGREVQRFGPMIVPRLTAMYRAVILACDVEWTLRDLHGPDPNAAVEVTEENLRACADRLVLALGQELLLGCHGLLGN